MGALRPPDILKIADIEPATWLPGVSSTSNREEGSRTFRAPRPREIQDALSQGLRLTDSNGERVCFSAASYHYDSPGGAARPEAREIVRVLERRPAATQQAFNETLTTAHGDHEMSFQVKDAKGEYTLTQNVPVHGVVVPYQEAHFQKLVRSTAPVMRALRDILKVVYSKTDFDAADLGLSEIPDAEANLFLQSIRESVYFEPKFVDPVMKDYPFLTVAGFDAAVGAERQPIFFEYNLGTPSGLSNNIQLLDILKARDPQMFAAIADKRPEDRTFEILRRAIESNALAWTNEPRGISVVVSPGVYNGAHPDVASIALFSGMPLVNPSDLYTDRDGFVRLNTHGRDEDPIVTGIYGRAEESFFFQSSEDGIPIRGAQYEDNVEMGRRLGVELENGIAYRFRYDDNDEVVGVHLDAEGRPQLQPVFESMGRDPTRPDVPPSSFVRAVKARRLYYSGLGGRTVDDKRVFEGVSRYLAPKYVESADEGIAQPPYTLRPWEYASFYESTDLHRYVVKVPDMSGGTGVKLLANLSPEERRAVVEAVKKAPEHYIVQAFADLAVTLSPEPSSDGEGYRYGTLANDLRIFTMMDAEGAVDAGPNSLLLRVAKPLSASTNTSQGAGYGIAAVVAETRTGRGRDRVLPERIEQSYTGRSRILDLESYIDRLNALTAATQADARGVEAGDGYATLLATLQRAVMDLLGRDFSPLMSIARRFDRKEIDRATFHEALLEHRAALYATEDFPAKIGDVVRRGLSRYRAPIEAVAEASTASTPDFEQIRAKLDIERFEAPVLVRRDLCGNGLLEKYAVGRYRSMPHPFLEEARQALEAIGGEIHAIRVKDAALTGWSTVPPSAYFRVDDEGVPTIGIDLACNFAMAAVAHEREHLKYWKTARDGLLSEGLSEREANVEAMKRVNTPEARLASEELAVAAELRAELEHHSEWNRGTPGPQRPTDRGWVARLGYPLQEAVFDLLHQHRWATEPSVLDEDKVKGYLGRLVDMATEASTKRFERLMRQAEKLEEQSSTRVAGLEQRGFAYAELNMPLFDRIFTPGALERFHGGGVRSELHRLFGEVLAARVDREPVSRPSAREMLRGEIQ